MSEARKPPGRTVRLFCAAAIVGQALFATGWAEDAAQPYVDRVIDPAQLPALRDDFVDRYDASGLPRAIFLEGTWGYTEIDGGRREEHGAAASAFWESDLWGAFSLDAGVYKSAFLGDYTTFGSFWQRGLNAHGGWRANNALGALNAPLPDLQRGQARFSIPANPMLGALSEWRHPDGLQLQAGAGVPGRYVPGRLSGFETDGGHSVSLAASWDPAPGWRAAVSLLSTQGREQGGVPRGGAVREGDSLFAAGAWTDDRTAIQFNALATRNDGEFDGTDSPHGAWIDVVSSAGWFWHNYGLFYLQPGLNWGGQLMNNDARGAYYRVSHRRMRWNWSASADHISPISAGRDDSAFGSATVRYQAGATFGVGASGTYRSASRDAWVANFFADQRHRFGITRYQLNMAGNDDDDSAWGLELNQTFPTEVGRRLAATAGVSQSRRSDRERSDVWSLALFGSQDLVARFSLDGSVRLVSTSGADAQDGVAANIGVNWQLSPQWRLLASYDRSSTSRRNPFVLEPFPGEVPARIDTDTESFFITLRYAFRAGSSSAVLGGMPGAPAGFIQGSVFLDENDSGARDAGEAGVANITVILNDRFSVRTDSQGNFSFPMVATGSYTLRVLSDNLPLPWSFADDEAVQQFELGVRQQVNVDFPARR